MQKKTDKNLEIYKRRPAIVGSGQDYSSLSVISKKFKLKSDTLTRISPYEVGSFIAVSDSISGFVCRPNLELDGINF